MTGVDLGGFLPDQSRDATVERLGTPMGAPKDAVQPGRRIATLHDRELGLSVALAFMSPDPA
jgi:hypothetical protein